jgi:CDP-6-deoxy-D-xylo-4-hexulose-3-dehydrase
MSNAGGQSPAIRVPYGRTVHGEEEIAAVVEVLRTSTQMGANVRSRNQ